MNDTSSNMPEKRHHTDKKYFTISLYAIVVILIGAIIWKVVNESELGTYFGKFFSVVSPFFVGAFIAFLLNPIANYFYDIFFGRYVKLKNNKLRTILSILCTYIIFIGLIIVLLAYIIPQIITSLTDIAAQIPIIYGKIEDFLINFDKNYPNLNIDYDLIMEQIENQDILQTVINKLSNLIPNIFTFLLNTSFTIIKLIINIFIAVMVSFYLITDKRLLIHSFKRFLYAFFPKKATTVIIDILKETNSIFSGFIFGKAIDSLIIGIICFIAMNIFQIKYSVLISVLVGVTNMIPYFGPYMGGAIGAVILVMVNPIKTVVFLVLILAIQQFDGLYLGPKILGKSLGTRPLWIIFAITVGGSLFGVIGMFLGVPIFTILSYILNRIIDMLLNKKQISFDKDISDLSHHIKETKNKKNSTE